MRKPPLIIILGPNASGKTSLSIKLARRFNGEVVSADSRQVYAGMDIGTGKASKREQRAVPHHLVDVAKPSCGFNVAHFKRLALRSIASIHRRGKLPFLVGGTGFWIQAAADNVDFPDITPNPALRRRLAKLPAAKLFAMLNKLDPKRARHIDRNNPYRLIRAIEIVRATKRPVPPIRKKPLFRTLYLGITHPKKILHQRIDQRLATRFAQGMVAEVRRLRRNGISWKRLYDFGLEYRYISLYLQGKLEKREMFEQLKTAIYHYAKRQMTWFKRDRRIHWVTSEAPATRLIKKFIG